MERGSVLCELPSVRYCGGLEIYGCLLYTSILSVGLDQYLVFHNSMVADKIEVIDYYVYRLGLITNCLLYTSRCV